MNIVKKRRLRNAVRVLLIILAIMCFLILWGTMGGMEVNGIGLKRGTIQCFASLTGFVGCTKLAGWCAA